MKVRKYALVVMVFLGLILAADSVLALRVSPVSFEREIKRGSQETLILQIGNTSAKPLHCRVYLTDYEVTRKGKPLFEEAGKKYSAQSFLEVKESEFSIPADGKKETEIKVSVPRNAKPGEYFAVIMTETQVSARVKGRDGTEIQMMVNARIGSIVRITVPGRTIRKKAEISEIRVEVPGPESKDRDIKVIATFENKCRLHLDAKGQVLIKNKEDQIFDKFVLQGAGRKVRGEAFVYPEGSRDFWAEVQRPLPAGEYIAEVSFSYGYQFRKVRAETSFFVTPQLGQKQKEFLTMTAEPNLLELKMSSGAFRARSIRVSNLDFEPLKVEVFSSANWLEVKPNQLTIRPRKYKTLRVTAVVPEREPVKRIGKILLKPVKGKEVVIDVVVSQFERKEVKK